MLIVDGSRSLTRYSLSSSEESLERSLRLVLHSVQPEIITPESVSPSRSFQPSLSEYNLTALDLLPNDCRGS